MRTIPCPDQIPENAVLVVINGDGTVTIYEAGDKLPEVVSNG